MIEDNDAFILVATREFARLRKLSDGAVAQVSKTQFFHRDGEGDNSIAVIYKHLAGNMISRWTDFLTSDGEKPDRNRDQEFSILDSDTYESILESWEAGWNVLFETLSQLGTGDLSRTVTIRGESLSALQAIGRQMTHYAYHIGQIVYLAKSMAAENWKTLSIPVGKSAEFNKSPEKYIEE